VFNYGGVQPDIELILVIHELKKPRNKKELQSFLGMIKYLRRFIPNLT